MELMTEKKLKILIVNYEYPPLGGGGGVATYDLAIEWEKKGQVDVLTSSFSDLPAFEISNGINIYRTKIFFRKSRDAATFLSMLSFLLTGFIRGIYLCRKNRYDVINTHFAVPSGPLGYILGKMFAIPNVLSLHGGDIYDPSKKLSPHKSPLFSRVVKFIMNRADRIVAQSTNTRDNAVKYYNPSKEVQIIPLPFHPPVIKKLRRGALSLDNDSFYFITVGRLIKRKSIDTMITALAGIKNSRIKLVIAGDGPEMDHLKGLASGLGLDDRIIFAGYIDEGKKFTLLHNADAFILTSLHEGFGIVFMEAMFAGLPIVCTNHGGQTDFLVEGINAFMFDVGDVEACRKSMMKLYKDKDIANKMSTNNRKRVTGFYAEPVAAEYIKIFNEISK